MDLFAIKDWPPKLQGKWLINGQATIKGIASVVAGELWLKQEGDHYIFQIELKFRKGFIQFMALRYRETYFHDGERILAVECRMRPKIHVPLIPIEIREKVEVKTLHDRQFLKHLGSAVSMENVMSIDWSEAEDCKPPMGVYFILPHIENLDFDEIGKFQLIREEGNFAFKRERMKISYDNGNYRVSGEHDHGSVEIDFVKK